MTVTARSGRGTALTVLSPMPRLWAGPLRAVLYVRKLLGPSRDLQRMSFIHFAHWSVITRFPFQERRSRYAYLLFRSDFNGSWDEYIDAFSIVIPRRMALIWGWSYGFPGALPTEPFRRYIRHNDLPVDHYWAAYPESSVTEVAAALRVRDAYRGHFGDLDPEAAPDHPAWPRFLHDVQSDLYTWERDDAPAT
ncbi:hypothetical protein Asp14428_00080 [Actinoplanes sp. NBRC 14428]|uniref:Uncharacterized protein n=1 Tax=Pseudosporangium ferrugineum TaxID=439699 RepID=A0A2T0SJ88_9ACTN|nr:hypothetical protein [Pseudosporangium ferrugineum]PRY33465.1 hypothetical protein CLV70_101628 [Pseudosporangium ferrugineum]BCJ48533.1 hypothetical protein Asp14428_00080 [Actinoplanes sp. NBRC 14428]